MEETNEQKRERFAAMFLQGILSSAGFNIRYKGVNLPKYAIKNADALIAALSKKPNTTEGTNDGSTETDET